MNSTSSGGRTRLPTCVVWIRSVLACIGLTPRKTASGVSPDFLGNFDHEAKLGPLFVFGKQIAFLGAGKAALRAETKLIEVDVFGRRLHPALDLVLGFELAGL